MIFQDSALAHQYLDGKMGIEIGPAAHNPFNIKDCIFVGRTPAQQYIDDQLKLCGKVQELDVICEADDIPFSDGSFDYVLSSHVIEHCYNVHKTITEWLRLLKPDGLIFMIIPHVDRTFDKGRDITNADHLRFRAETPDEDPHTDEHHNVWRTEDFLAICREFDWNVIDHQDVDDKVGNGFTIVIQK